MVGTGGVDLEGARVTEEVATKGGTVGSGGRGRVSSREINLEE